jgi:hypothetical protein
MHNCIWCTIDPVSSVTPITNDCETDVPHVKDETEESKTKHRFTFRVSV